MFSRLHRKVRIVFTLSKTIISDFWTQSALTHTAMTTLQPKFHYVTLACDDSLTIQTPKVMLVDISALPLQLAVRL